MCAACEVIKSATDELKESNDVAEVNFKAFNDALEKRQIQDVEELANEAMLTTLKVFNNGWGSQQLGSNQKLLGSQDFVN